MYLDLIDQLEDFQDRDELPTISRERIDQIIKEHHCDPKDYAGRDCPLELYRWLGY